MQQTTATADLLDPNVLAGLSNLELVAKAAVEGFLVGLHRSPRFGFSQEFAEYKAYVEGDDPRFIDWNVYARTDRTYVKRFLGETNSHLMVLLDASASMGYRSRSQLTKLRYGQFLAACLTHLAARQHDAVGALIFADEVRDFRPPSSRAGNIQGVLHTIDRAQPDRGTNLATPLHRFRQHVRRRGLVAVISDFYCDASSLLAEVEPLAYQGQDVILFQVLDRQELTPEFSDHTLLEDVETSATVEVSPRYLSEDYPGRIEKHIEDLSDTAKSIGADHVLLTTDERLDRPLRDYFLFRQRRA